MNRKGTKQGGDKVALLALLGMLLIFVVIVGRGWQTLFSAHGIYVSVFVAAVVAAIAAILSWAIASERVHRPDVIGTALAYFFILFNISALGTVNAMFVMFQSGNIIRNEIQDATQSVVALRDRGSSSIDTAEYDKFRSDIDQKWRNLRAELENPQLCGQGPVAAARIAELQFVLPSFRPLAGGGQCLKVPLLVAAYERQIGELVKTSPTYVQYRGQVARKERIREQSQKMLDTLVETSKSLNDAFALGAVKAKLFEISEQYTVLRNELAQHSKVSDSEIPLRLNMDSVSALGEIGQVLPFILSRLSEVSTYVYLFIALVLDIAIISAFKRVLQVGPTRGQRHQMSAVRKI